MHPPQSPTPTFLYAFWCVCVLLGRGVQKKLIRSKMSNSTSASSERTPLLASQSSSIMVNPGSSSIQEPSTPPIVVEEKQNAPGAYDTQSMSEAEWERSSETFHVKSTTPSMVNYAEFSTSVDMSTTAAGAATEGASGADRGAGDSGNGDLLGEGEGNSSEQGAGDSGSVDLLGEGEENSSEQGAGDSGSVDLLGEGEGNSSEQGAGDSGSVDLLGEGEENSSEQGESAGAKNREDDIPGDELEGSVEKSTTVIAWVRNYQTEKKSFCLNKYFFDWRISSFCRLLAHHEGNLVCMINWAVVSSSTVWMLSEYPSLAIELFVMLYYLSVIYSCYVYVIFVFSPFCSLLQLRAISALETSLWNLLFQTVIMTSIVSFWCFPWAYVRACMRACVRACVCVWVQSCECECVFQYALYE